jgi:hypothetical protein
MRFCVGSLIAFVALGLGGCRQQDADKNARRVGREAHEAARKTEKAAKTAGRELRETGQQVREGWNEGKRESKTSSKK